MARGAARKTESSNGPPRTRGMSRRSRNHPSRGMSEMVHQDKENECRPTSEEGKIPLEDSGVKSKPVNRLMPMENKLNGKRTGGPPSECDKKSVYESSFVLSSKSEVVNAANKIIGKSHVSKKCDTFSQVYSQPRTTSKEDVSEHKPKCDTENLKNGGLQNFLGVDISDIVLEIVLHANTVIYGLMSLSANQFTKVATSNGKFPVAVDSVMVKIFFTLILGFLGDFLSPFIALLIPQVTCLVVGFSLSLQVLPQHLAFIAFYLPQLNSGLIGTQLLLKLAKPPGSFSASLSRINCIYCLTDIFSPWLLKVITENFGFTLSYQVMAFSSFLVLGGVLYMFHTNHRKGACQQHEMSFPSSFLIRLFLSIPMTLLLPRFQYLLQRAQKQNGTGLVTAVALIVQQVVLVPILQSFYRCQKIIQVSAAMIALLSLLLVVMDDYVGFMLLIIIYGIAGVVQNFVVSLLVNSCPGMSGLLLAVNLISYFGIRYLAAQITGGMPSSCDREDECRSVAEAIKLMSDGFLKNLWSWFIGYEMLGSKSVYLNMVYVMCSMSGIVVFFITKYI